MRKTVAGLVSAAILTGGLAVGIAANVPAQQGIWHQPTTTVQAWSFDNKTHKNKNRPTIHHGLW